MARKDLSKIILDGNAANEAKNTTVPTYAEMEKKNGSGAALNPYSGIRPSSLSYAANSGAAASGTRNSPVDFQEITGASSGKYTGSGAATGNPNVSTGQSGSNTPGYPTYSGTENTSGGSGSVSLPSSPTYQEGASYINQPVKIDSYEEYLQKLADSYLSDAERSRSYYGNAQSNATAYAQRLRDLTYREAEAQSAAEKEAALKARESQLDAALSAYETGKSSYGALAEKLGDMGLTGSGYGEYLDSRNYATYREEATNAENTYQEALKSAKRNESAAKLSADTSYATNEYNAQKEYDAGMLNTDLSYNSNMRGIADKAMTYAENERAEAQNEQVTARQNYLSLLQSVAEGTISPTYARQFAEAYGLNEDQISRITAAAESYAAMEAEETLANAKTAIESDPSAYSYQSIAQQAQNIGISGDSVNELLSLKTADYYSKIASGSITDADLSALDAEYQSGYVPKSDYQSIYEQYAAAYLGENGENAKSYDDKVEKLYKAGKISTLQRKNLLEWKVYAMSWFADDKSKLSGYEWEGKYPPDSVKKELQTSLNMASTGSASQTPEIGTIIVYDGKAYTYTVVSYGVGMAEKNKIKSWYPLNYRDSNKNKIVMEKYKNGQLKHYNSYEEFKSKR